MTDKPRVERERPETCWNTAGYAEYHVAVVEACAKLMGEKHRLFFDAQCTYETEFREGLTPDECAETQYEALT